MAWFDVVGTTGVLLIVFAYAATQMKRMDPEGIRYSLLNLVGAILITISLFYAFNLASLIIEIFWIIFSIWGIWRWSRTRNEEPPSEAKTGTNQ